MMVQNEENNMKEHYSPGPLIRFLLYPLMFILQYSYEGIVAGVGVLLIYPFLSMVVDLLQKKLPSIDSYYITSFLGVFLGALYILSVGVIDWKLYNKLVFIFPASLTASSMLLGWLQEEEYEKIPFIEGLIVAFLIIIFSCFRDFYAHGTLDFRFGPFGSIYTFGSTSPFKEKLINLFPYMYKIKFSLFQLRAINFFVVALIIGILCIPKNKKDVK